MPVLTMAVRLILVFVLAAAVFGKLRGAESRRDYLKTFHEMGLPARLRWPVAVGLVLAEVVTAVLLLIPATVAVGSAAAVLLFGLLAGGVLRIVRMEQKVSCNCFGAGRDANLSAVHVVRNLALFAVALGSLGLSLNGTTAALPQAAVAAFGALIIAAIVVRLDDLVDLVR